MRARMRWQVLVLGLVLGVPVLAAGPPVDASALLGALVLDRRGERLGIVNDLAVDVVHGAVAYAIVEYDDPGGVRINPRPVPLAELRPALARDRLVLEPGAAAGASAQPRADARLMRASTLLGMSIEHPSGADYGVIVDLGVELDSERVRCVAVRLDGAAANAPLREVPLSALRFPPGGGKALLTLAAAGRCT